MNYRKLLFTAFSLVFITLGFSNAALAQTECDTITPDFSSNAPRCTGDAVDFIYTQPDYDGLTYDWDFGSGASPAIDTGLSPTGIIYATPGLKLVTLTVTITIGTTTCIKTKTSGISIEETPNPGFTDNGSQCEQADFDFTDTSSSGTGWVYNWDFGVGANPAVSGARHPSGIRYTGSGSKSVSFTVSNGSCVGNFTNSITVLNKPNAGFSVVSPACTNDGVSFTNTGTSAVFYTWDFGSGANPATSTSENPNSVVYSTSGSKSIEQIVRQGTCYDTSIQNLSVVETPAPGFIPVASTCEGAPVGFTYNGSTGTGWTYSWDFGTGSSPSVSSAQNPLGVLYNVPGKKYVSITVTNQNCSEVLIDSLTIDPRPQSGFSSSSLACSNDSVNFTNTGTTGLSYAWTFGTGSTPSNSVSENVSGIIYSSPGIKNIRQIAYQGACTDTSFGTVNVTESPAPSITNPLPQCEGGDVDFSYAGTTGAGWNYLWDFGMGSNPSISSAQNPTGIQYTGSGLKTVTLTVSNQFCSKTDTGSVRINSTPTSSFSSSAPGCTGDSINFLNTGSSGLTYKWNFGSSAGPDTSILENPIGIIYSTPGIKTVSQIVSQGACSDTSFLSINLTETPNPSFSSNGPKCEGSPVSFSYLGSTGNGWTYLWDFGSGSSPAISTAQIPGSVIYSGSGTKSITLSANNQGCSQSFTDTLVIELNPVASFSTTAPSCTGDSVFFSNTGTSIPGTAYSWTFNGAIPGTSALSDPTAIFSNAGASNVELSVTVGNCSDTTSQFITINETPSISFSSNAPMCALDAVSFANTGSGGNNWNYQWDFGSGSFPSTSTSENPGNIRYNAGGSKTVSLNISDANCSNSDTATIQIFSLPISNAGEDTTICADECLELGVPSTSGYLYSWFPASTLDNSSKSNPIACPLASVNIYMVATSDTNNCTNSDTIVVTMLPSAIARAGNDVEVCIGDTVQIGAALIEGQSYNWSPSAGLDNDSIPSPLASPDSTTNYQVAVSYKGCEIITDEVQVTVHQNPIVSAGEDVTIANGSSTQLLATGAIMYEWTPSTGLSNPGIANPIASPDETTTYTVFFTDINSCINSDSITVTVIEADVWAPDAFTPNGDGANDIFYVRVNGAKTFDLMIYNRSGEMIFRSQNPEIGWDGTRQGSSLEMSTGAYVYSAKGQLSDGNSFVQSGMINLIR